MASLSFNNVCKIYDKEVKAVSDFCMEIKDGEFIVLVGPSGCGKSTTLRMVAGLEEISSGEIYIDGVLVNDVSPKDRDIAMVFQNYALYPHMTVYENMAFSLKLRKEKKSIIDERVRRAAEILDITDLLKRKPKALSGGQRQRVAIGRAIVRDPKVFLMDEPLSNLDAKLRGQMRAEILKLHEQLGATFIYVTHDQTEAMTLGDRIVIMQDGFVRQIGSPREVYDHPQNVFVAGFIGTPQMNFFDGELGCEDGKYILSLDGHRVPLAEKHQSAFAAKNVQPCTVTVGVRPDRIKIVSEGGFEGRIELRELMGSAVNLHVMCLNTSVVATVQMAEMDATTEAFSAGMPVRVDFDPEYMHIFDKESGNTLL